MFMPDQPTPDTPDSLTALTKEEARLFKPTGPDAGRKPTGAFSTKQVMAGIAVLIAGVFLYLAMFSAKPKPKHSQLQSDLDDGTRAAAAGAAAASTNAERHYPELVEQATSSKQNRTAALEYGSTPDAPTEGNTQAPDPPDDTVPANSISNSHANRRRSTARADRGHTANTGNSAKSTDDPDPEEQAEAVIAAEMQKREAQSFFAPLLVINNRPATPADKTPQPAPPQSSQPTPLPAAQPLQSPPPIPPTPRQDLPASPTTEARTAPAAAPRRVLQSASNTAAGPTHKLFEGTPIEAVLTNRLNGTYTGPVNCMVSVPVWSHNRQHILIPQGTRVLGEAHKVSAIGQQRLAVTFHRLIMPDGFSVPLDQFTGMNGIGETGLKDKVDNHYRQIFGVSIALGAISGLAMRGTSAATTQSGLDMWKQGFSQSLSQEATQILDRFLNILPTVIIREGTRVVIYLTDDLSLPAYESHHMASDL